MIFVVGRKIEMKELSIIIPHYNTPQLLMKLLESIPDVPEIEVLVIDDSSDKDLKIYEQCEEKNKERNVQFFKNSIQTKGAGNARNVGLEHAKGKWLLFADADDYFVNNFWNILQEYLNDPADIIYFEPTSILLKTGELSDRHEYYANLVEQYCQKHEYNDELQLRYRYWSPCSKIVKKGLVEQYQIRFDGTLHSNDVMFSAKVGHYAKSVEAVNKVIYCITQSEKSLTANKNSEALSIRKKVFCNYYFFLFFHITRKNMKKLGFGLKDFIYFCLYRIGLLK